MRNFLANNVADKACSQHIFSDKALLFQGRLSNHGAGELCEID